MTPINTATQLRSPSQFVHRQSDNTLHWVLGGVAPPHLAEARAEEGLSETRERERMWYVTCTRARDILIIPHLPSASSRSRSRIVDLGHSRLPVFDLTELPNPAATSAPVVENLQTKERFAMKGAAFAASAPALIWRRPSDHDSDRAQSFEVAPGAIDGSVRSVELVGAGRLRGILLHKLMEQFLKLMSGGGAIWRETHRCPIARAGQREDVYWTYSYSPIDERRCPTKGAVSW